MDQRGPIGVFDSGLGGLSVLRELVRLMPGTDVVYVADSANVPYGTKPPEFIRERSLAITRFLLETEHARGVVVACNTATTHAVAALRDAFPAAPIVGMEPALKPAAAATRSGVVGVLATPATLDGERFAALAQRYTDGVELLTQPSPGLVECVEAGDVDGPETERLLRLYTGPMLARGADTIVLGCTHYPFLRGALQRLVGSDVALIDTGEAVARQTARVLGLDATSASRQTSSPGQLSVGRAWSAPPADVTYYSSGDVNAARRVIAALLQRPVERVLPLPV
jgi:glutamate racemase